MSPALKLVRLDELTFERVDESSRVRLHLTLDPAVRTALANAQKAVDRLRTSARWREYNQLRRLVNRIKAAANLNNALGPLGVAHRGIIRATTGEYIKVLAAIERLAEDC
jgi:hypothetical protein